MRKTICGLIMVAAVGCAGDVEVKSERELQKPVVAEERLDPAKRVMLLDVLALSGIRFEMDDSTESHKLTVYKPNEVLTVIDNPPYGSMDECYHLYTGDDEEALEYTKGKTIKLRAPNNLKDCQGALYAYQELMREE